MNYTDNLIEIEYNGNPVIIPKFIQSFKERGLMRLVYESSIKNFLENTQIENGMAFCISSMGSMCGLEAGCHINGIELNADDFGESFDTGHDNNDRPEYGCGNRVFEPSHATEEVLEKYDINSDQWYHIASLLESELSFGRCGRCA
jgi:hypothetical protein